MIRLLLFFALLLPCLSSNAQKILQLEKRGKIESRKFFVGDEVTFRMKGEEVWRTVVIEDIQLGVEILYLGTYAIQIKDIEAIRTFENRRFAFLARRGLSVFGGSWSIFSLLGMLVGNEYRISDAYVTLTSIGLGWLTHLIFRQKTHKLGKRKWLRLIDLNPIEKRYGP